MPSATPTTSITHPLGRRMRERREELGMSTEQMAAMFNVHQTTVSGWERKGPPGDRLREVAENYRLPNEEVQSLHWAGLGAYLWSLVETAAA